MDSSEVAAATPGQPAPFARLSVELGHLYSSKLAAEGERLRRHFRRVAAWAEVAMRLSVTSSPGRDGSGVSTCFLVDDYFGEVGPPAKVIPDLVASARQCGLEIDYIARESGCVAADGVELAGLVADRIRPQGGANERRPPASVTGWLSNGQRSPGAAGPGNEPAAWYPPEELGEFRHSVFVDVELWDEAAGERIWSCALLAAVWQLLRLGLLRNGGAPVAVPRQWSGAFPDDWQDLPAIVQLNEHAAPFHSYRSMSIIPRRYLSIEQAARIILQQVEIGPAAAQLVSDSAAAEGLQLPAHPADRVEYVFTG